MKLLITGGSGQVGWELRRSLAAIGDVIALDRCQLDLSQPERLPDLVRNLNPDVIVNAAAYTAVDHAEGEEALATMVNGTAVGIMAREAARGGILMIHYSTDYVFDGCKSIPYVEDDPPCPINAYGRSKLVGEIAVRQAGGAHLVLRTSWIYGARGPNFLRTMLALMRERDELRIVDDQIGAPTWASEIARATAVIIETAAHERRQGRFASELLHLTASGATSWHGFAVAILAGATKRGLLTDRTPKLLAIASRDYPCQATRPRNSQLAGDRLSERFAVALPRWEEGLAMCLEEMKWDCRHSS